VAHLPLSIAERMRDAALDALSAVPGAAPCIDTVALLSDMAAGAGDAIVVHARTEHSVLGASRVAERGVPAEALGAAVGEALAADLAANAGVDTHAADQLLVYLALAGGGSYTTRMLTLHASTGMWLIEQFLPVRFLIRAAFMRSREEALRAARREPRSIADGGRRNAPAARARPLGAYDKSPAGERKEPAARCALEVHGRVHEKMSGRA